MCSFGILSCIETVSLDLQTNRWFLFIHAFRRMQTNKTKNIKDIEKRYRKITHKRIISIYRIFSTLYTMEECVNSLKSNAIHTHYTHTTETKYLTSIEKLRNEKNRLKNIQRDEI